MSDDLKRAAIAGSLAQAIYYARAELHGWPRHWYALGAALKHHYVEEAAALLQPPYQIDGLFEQVAAVARAQAAAVIGRIDPAAPWGTARADAPSKEDETSKAES